MRIILGTSAGLLLSAPLLLLPMGADGDGQPGHPHPPTEVPGQGPEVCSTGCSAVPALDRSLSAEEFERLLADFAQEPMNGASLALETLLFHGEAAALLLENLGSELSPEREAFLRQELAITHALLDVRIIDETGVERLHLGQTSVPFGEKQHLHPHDTEHLQPPEVSGTIHRVGLEHLWARL